jgi:UDP-GlcNAc:undecaprenyl-phosphate GlcNAc-1-phosphate transferase
MRLAGAFAGSAALAFVLSPAAILLAVRLQLLDRPVGYKAHSSPTPYLGGAAVLLATGVAAMTFTTDVRRTVVVLGGALVLCGVGTVDDRRGLGPLVRVLAAALVATAVWSLGFGWSLRTGRALELLITVIWVVGLVNAMNLLDNMDGAAGTVAAAIGLGIVLFALFDAAAGSAVTPAALAGGCVGFLRYNLARPARIFLGDGGSMPIGFLLAMSAMALPIGGQYGLSALVIAGALVAVPALDTTLVIVSRERRHVPVLQGGCDHLTHRLLKRLRRPAAVAGVLAAVQLVLDGLVIAGDELGVAPALVELPALVTAAVAVLVIFDSPAWRPGGAVPRASGQPPIAVPDGRLELSRLEAGSETGT